jgi:dihydrofolate reductase
MSINIIAAISNTRQLGLDNKLLCHLPNDLKRFKQLTENNFVVMGSNTFHSLGRSLPNRHNLVLTRKTKHGLPRDVFVYNSISDILDEYENYADKQVELWVIGGQNVYEQFLKHADKLFITVIDHHFPEADVHFPEIDLTDWRVVEHIVNKGDDTHEFDFHYVIYERKK